ncbi:MAG: RluA family pseudouridine synthase [Acholeplasmataceae bacterium]
MSKKYLTDPSDQGQRLDQYLMKEVLSDHSRSHIQHRIKSGNILVDGNIVKTGYTIKGHEIISIEDFEEKTLDLEPVDLSLDIVYEDEDLFVINKPQGMVVHPASSYREPTLVHGLLFEADKLSSINGTIRPGIVHRIDKDTSGLLIVAKTDQAHRVLSDDLKSHDINRYYVALVHGAINENQGTIDAPIARNPKNRLKMSVHDQGKHAVTHFTVKERFHDLTYLECQLETGRTHQIRVHMAYIKHPILGDPLYGYKEDNLEGGQFLHAYKLTFTHPIKKEQMTFEVDLPKRFLDKINELKLNSVL